MCDYEAGWVCVHMCVNICMWVLVWAWLWGYVSMCAWVYVYICLSVQVLGGQNLGASHVTGIGEWKRAWKNLSDNRRSASLPGYRTEFWSSLKMPHPFSKHELLICKRKACDQVISEVLNFLRLILQDYFIFVGCLNGWGGDSCSRVRRRWVDPVLYLLWAVLKGQPLHFAQWTQWFLLNGTVLLRHLEKTSGVPKTPSQASWEHHSPHQERRGDLSWCKQQFWVSVQL